MNRSFEKQRMSMKSSRNSLLAPETKRAAKTISCMRNGKVSSSSNSASNYGSSSSKLSSIDQQQQQRQHNNDDVDDDADDDDENNSRFALKQEPDDSYYDDDAAYLQQQQQQEGLEDEEEEEDADGGHRPQSSGGSRPGYPTILTRVRSHSRSLRAMANPSAVWAHFDLCSNDPLRAQCRICGAVVVRGGANPRQCGTTNLHRHLRVHHGGRLVGKRYQVVNEKGGQSSHDHKALRIATQNLMRQMRHIAPAPTSSTSPSPSSSGPQNHAQRQAQQIQQTVQAAQQQQQQQQQQRQQQQHQQHHQRSTMQPKSAKTLLLKTIPLKMKQVAPTTIKVPPVRHSLQNFQQLPQTVMPQQPTEVCLRWNSYHSNMQHSFPSLLDNEQFVDVTLACEGRSLKCHKMILSSCSDYLAQLLRENPCQHPIILMRDLKYWEVEALVKFMYRGEVNVTHDKLPQLLNAAEALQVKGLAGPSNTQSPKPPLLIPQPKASAHHPINRSHTDTKEKPSTSTSNSMPILPSSASSSNHILTSTPNSSSIPLKRGIKRRNIGLSDVPDARPFTKIRLQRPVTPSATTTKQQHQHQQQQQQLRDSGNVGKAVGATGTAKGEGAIETPAVKEEPIDIPLSPGDHLYQTHTTEDGDSSDGPTFESIIRMHQEEDPGGEDIELADQGSDYDNNEDDEDEDDEDAEQMEFVPTDFLEQEQDIAEDSEEQQSNRNSMSYNTDDDSKQRNNEEDAAVAEAEEEEQAADEEDHNAADEEEAVAEKSEAEEEEDVESRLERSKKDKDKEKT